MGVFDRLNNSLERQPETTPTPEKQVFDRLNTRIDSGKPEGVTPLDIADLPRLEQQIMFFMLRNQQAAIEGVTLEMLHIKFPDQPEAKIVETLAELFKNGWVIPLGESSNAHYKINLRRKRGASFNGVWSKLLDKLPEKPSDKPWDFNFQSKIQP